MPGPGSDRFRKALKTASSGDQSKYDQARHVQRKMERSGKSKQSSAKAAMAAAKGHLADGMSLEAAMEAALAELELPGGQEEEETPWMDTPYPTGKDPRYDERDGEMPTRQRLPGERTAIPPIGRKY